KSHLTGPDLRKCNPGKFLPKKQTVQWQLRLIRTLAKPAINFAESGFIIDQQLSSLRQGVYSVNSDIHLPPTHRQFRGFFLLDYLERRTLFFIFEPCVRQKG